MKVRLLSLCLLLLAACEPPLQRMDGACMGSQWHVVLHGGRVSQLRPRIVQRIEQLEQCLSHWRIDSELSLFNSNRSTDWQPISTDLGKVLATALEVAAETHGALDVTLAPLVDLWGFGAEQSNTDPPNTEEITTALAKCGWKKVQVRQEGSQWAARKLQPRVQLNLSSLAEGYAVDEVVALLQRAKVPGALVDVGGELRAYGTRADGRLWTIAVQHPDGLHSAQTLELKDEAAATSGTYRQRFIHHGRAYSHILDPRTGHPISHRLTSVTVLHPSAMIADAYATALLVLGPEEGRALAQRIALKTFMLEAAE